MPRLSQEEPSRLYTRGIRGFVNPLPSGRYRARLKVVATGQILTPAQLQPGGKGGSFGTPAEAWAWCEAAHDLIVVRGRFEDGRLVVPESPKEEGERRTIAEIAQERFWETGRKKRNTTKTMINQRGQF